MRGSLEHRRSRAPELLESAALPKWLILSTSCGAAPMPATRDGGRAARPLRELFERAVAPADAGKSRARSTTPRGPAPCGWRSACKEHCRRGEGGALSRSAFRSRLGLRLRQRRPRPLTPSPEPAVVSKSAATRGRRLWFRRRLPDAGVGGRRAERRHHQAERPEADEPPNRLRGDAQWTRALKPARR